MTPGAWIGFIVLAAGSGFVLGIFFGWYLDDRKSEEAKEWAEFKQWKRKR